MRAQSTVGILAAMLFAVLGECTDAWARPTEVGPHPSGYVGLHQAYAPVDMSFGSTALSFTNTDDGSAPVNLGTNTFRFFDVTYAGASSIFVSTNGLISFGAANTSWDNTADFSTLALPAIAVLWDDWMFGTGTPQVRYKLRDVDADGVMDWLTIEWNQILHLNSTSNTVTFQASLRLNTGPLSGDIVLAYPDTVTTNPYSLGGNATVGIKPAASRNWLLWSHNQAVVMSFETILFTRLHAASIERLDADPAPAGLVHFRVRFAPVNQVLAGLDVSDFSLTTTGSIAGASVVSVDPPVASPWDAYNVTVNTGSGAGTIRLDVGDDDSVSHPAWGALTGPYVLGGVGAGNGNFTTDPIYNIVVPLCPADVNGDHTVSVADLLAVINDWGPCANCPPSHCVSDIAPAGPPQGDCQVNVSDLLAVISSWGACP